MTPTTWIVIANGSRARVFASDDKLEKARLVAELEHSESRAKGHELTTDDRGRTRPRNKDAVRGAAHAYTTTPHDVEIDRFSREVAERLRLAYARNELDSLVLVASPQFLGALLSNLVASMQPVVRATLAKDYTNERPEIALERVRRELLAQD